MTDKTKNLHCCDAKYELEMYKKVIAHARELFLDGNYEAAFRVLCKIGSPQSKSNREERLKSEPY